MAQQSRQTPGKKRIITPRRSWWKPGVSGNPGGKKRLPQEIRDLKNAALEQAIIILHNQIQDPVSLVAMGPSNRAKYLEMVFDRFGLPKTVRNEMTGKDGEPIKQQVDWSKVDEKTLKKLANEI